MTTIILHTLKYWRPLLSKILNAWSTQHHHVQSYIQDSQESTSRFCFCKLSAQISASKKNVAVAAASSATTSLHKRSSQASDNNTEEQSVNTSKYPLTQLGKHGESSDNTNKPPPAAAKRPALD